MQASRVTSELGEGPAFGSCPFDPEEQQVIQRTLQSPPSTNMRHGCQHNVTSLRYDLSYFVYDRSNTLGSKIDLANELFLFDLFLFVMCSFNGWSDRIMSLNVDYMEQELSLWCVGVTAIVRVILKDGSYHENIGFAEAKYASKGAAIQEAKTVCL